MQEKYQPDEIEAAARDWWREHESFAAVAAPHDKRPKYYCLSMFPYPSGKLHMGHVRNYTIGDVLARNHMMRGHNVLQPMGWDAFGLPAENAAMQNGVPPAQWTRDNIAYMKKQLQALGFAFDWRRELATCDPDYYRWNQWLFLRMLEKGLVYKKTQVVNWDPVDQTVLANEQVIEGRGWRTGALVEKREIPGYYLAITRYADELLAGLDDLPQWPERVRAMQANWIGKSVGVRFAFPWRDDDGQRQLLWVFTTRADTIMGVTFCAVAAEHPLATRAARDNPQLAAFIERCKQGSVMEADMATMEKEGMPSGLFVEHPLSGERIEVWVGNYVLMAYGDGAVMGVPAHDERDFAFANKYGIPMRQVIAVAGEEFDAKQWRPWCADKQNGVCVNSGKYDGLDYSAATAAVAADLESRGLGAMHEQYRLRDWGVSRQRYWGCPIPVIHCPVCGDVAVADAQLPVLLPEDCVPDGGGNPLNRREDFVNCACPQCGGAARRETDTMDTFVDSSWYYARYCVDAGADSMVDAGADYWMPVDQYVGGIEHAILHLLYSRFWSKVMRDLGLVRIDEPFTRLLTQGMVLNHIFSRRNERGGVDYFAPDEIDVLRDEEGRISGATARADGGAVDYNGIGTMSKSKRNGVDPQALIERYGADTARFFMMFAAPPEQTLEWSDAGVEGAARFLRRMWAFACVLDDMGGDDGGEGATAAVVAPLRREIHLLLRQANHDMEKMQFNTVASATMKMLNALEKAPRDATHKAVLREGFSILLRVLAPIAPHVCHELWRRLGYGDDILRGGWPQPQQDALVEEETTLVVQVNGKLRGEIRVAADAPRDVVEAAALACEGARKFVAGKTVRKIIIVPSRLVNIVV